MMMNSSSSRFFLDLPPRQRAGPRQVRSVNARPETSTTHVYAGGGPDSPCQCRRRLHRRPRGHRRRAPARRHAQGSLAACAHVGQPPAAPQTLVQHGHLRRRPQHRGRTQLAGRVRRALCAPCAARRAAGPCCSGRRLRHRLAAPAARGAPLVPVRLPRRPTPRPRAHLRVAAHP